MPCIPKYCKRNYYFFYLSNSPCEGGESKRGSILLSTSFVFSPELTICLAFFYGLAFVEFFLAFD